MPACRHFLMWVFKILVLTLLEETDYNHYLQNKRWFNRFLLLFFHFWHFYSKNISRIKKPANSFYSFWFRRTLLEETNKQSHIFDTATLTNSIYLFFSFVFWLSFFQFFEVLFFRLSVIFLLNLLKMAEMDCLLFVCTCLILKDWM